MTEQTYYKVTRNGQSCHNGTHTWSLPTANADGTYAPGAWTPEIATPTICKTGWHLTTDPMEWPVIGMEVYAAEPDVIHGRQHDKIVTNRSRLLRPAPEMVPEWWHAVEWFVQVEIPAVPFCKPDGKPDPAWRLFTAPTLDDARDAAWSAAMVAAGAAAWDAAGDAAGAAAWDAAGAAAWDARLYTLTERVCADLPLDQKHRDHARAHWNVWQKGYCLLRDVDGVLYVYAADTAPNERTESDERWALGRAGGWRRCQ